MEPFRSASARLAVLWCVVLGGGGAGLARAGSITGDYSANHVSLGAQSQSAFVGATVTDTSPVGTDAATAAPPALPHPPFRDAVTAASSLAPASGLAKDGMTGTAQVTFVTATAAANDTFTFNFDASGSAGNARNTVAEPASGLQDMKANVGFFVDSNFGPTPAPPGTAVGAVSLPAVRNITAGEAISGSFLVDGTVTAVLSPGDPPRSFTLLTGHAYKLEMKYSLTVPNGTDPTTNFTYTGTVIPEPAALSVVGLGLLPWQLGRRRRRAGGG